MIQTSNPDPREVIRRLTEAGASDEEIVSILSKMKASASEPKVVEERDPTSSMSISGAPVLPDARTSSMQDIAGEGLGGAIDAGKALASGFGSGLKTSLARTAGIATDIVTKAPSSALSALGFKDVAEDLRSVPKALRSAKLAEVDPNSKTGLVEKAGQFGGQLVGNLPIYAGVAGVLRTGGTALAAKVSDPVLKSFLTRSVPGSFWKSAAASIPANVVEGVASDAIVYPEDVSNPEGVIRSAAFSLFGTIFDGYAGSKVLGEALGEASDPSQIAKVVDAIEEVKKTPVVPGEPVGPSSALPEGEYSRWIPSASAVSAKRVDDLLYGPMPTAKELAMNRNSKLFKELADERLLSIAKEQADLTAKQAEVAKRKKGTFLFTGKGQIKSIVPVVPSADDRIAAASMQNAIDKTAEEMKTLIQIRKSSGTAVDRMSFLDADVSGNLLTFEELDNLRRQISTEFREKGYDSKIFDAVEEVKKTPDASAASTKDADGLLPTARELAMSKDTKLFKDLELSPHQRFLKSVDERLGNASKKGFKNMSVKEILDLEDDLLAMSHRLDESGFDQAPKPFILDVPSAPKNTTPRRRDAGTVKVEETPKPTRFKTGVEKFLPRGKTLYEIRKASDNDLLAKAMEADIPPKVTIVPTASLDEALEGKPLDYANAVREANIDYSGNVEKTGPQPTIRQKLDDANLPVREISQESYDILSNVKASRRSADAAVKDPGGLLLPKLSKDGVWRGDVEDPINAMPIFEIQRQAGNRLTELEAFLKARLTLYNPSINTGMSEEAAQVVVDGLKDDTFMQNLANEFKKNTDFLIDYRVRLGLLDAERGAKYKEAPYAPLGRMFNKARRSNPMLARLGSARKSAPIFEQTIEQFYTTIERSQRNYAWKRVIDAWKADPIKYSDHIGLAEAPNENLFKEEIAEAIAAGLPEKEAADWVFLTHSGTFDPSDGKLVVYDKGILSKYSVSDALAVTIKSASPLELNVVGRIMMNLTIPMRESVALGLDLSGIGPTSDALGAASRDPGFDILTSPIQGLWHAALKTPTYKKAVAANLGFGGRLRPDNNFVKIAKDGTKVKVKTWPNPVSAANSFIRPISEASRVGLYISQINQGKTPHQAAAFANDALGNWNKQGASQVIRAWSLMTEFFNVGVQSGKIPFQAASAAIKDPKLASRMATVGAMGITMPTLYFLNAYKDDEEINALRKATNYDYWWWRDGKGEPQRMRKLGWWMYPIFGSSVEAAWDGMGKEEQKRFASSFANALQFNVMPITAQSILGLLNNDTSPLNPFSNIPIVPGSQQQVSSGIQGSLQNSKLSMAVRDAVGVSPFKTDFILRQALGSDLAALITIASGGTVGTKDRLPIFGRYSVSPRSPTEGSSHFYNDLEKSREVDRTLKEYLLKGDEAGFEKYLKKNEQWVEMNSKLTSYSQDLAKINTLLRMISADSTMSKEAKRNFEAEYRGYMNEFFLEYAKIRKELMKQ